MLENYVTKKKNIFHKKTYKGKIFKKAEKKNIYAKKKKNVWKELDHHPFSFTTSIKNHPLEQYFFPEC